MSSTIFSVKCSLVYLCVTGNKRLYAKVITVTRSRFLIFSCLKFSFPVIFPTVGRYRDSVKNNKRSSKSKVTYFPASPCTLIKMTLFVSVCIVHEPVIFFRSIKYVSRRIVVKYSVKFSKRAPIIDCFFANEFYTYMLDDAILEEHIHFSHNIVNNIISTYDEFYTFI